MNENCSRYEKGKPKTEQNFFFCYRVILVGSTHLVCIILVFTCFITTPFQKNAFRGGIYTLYTLLFCSNQKNQPYHILIMMFANPLVFLSKNQTNILISCQIQFRPQVEVIDGINETADGSEEYKNTQSPELYYIYHCGI